MFNSILSISQLGGRIHFGTWTIRNGEPVVFLSNLSFHFVKILHCFEFPPNSYVFH